LFTRQDLHFISAFALTLYISSIPMPINGYQNLDLFHLYNYNYHSLRRLAADTMNDVKNNITLAIQNNSPAASILF